MFALLNGRRRSTAPAGRFPQSMPSLHLARRTRLPIGKLLLLVAVFGWGLQYKLSLYHHCKPAHSTANPPAKLLTEAERTETERRATFKAAAVPVVPISLAGPSGPAGLATTVDAGSSRTVAFLHLALAQAPPDHLRSARSFIRPPPPASIPISAGQSLREL